MALHKTVCVGKVRESKYRLHKVEIEITISFPTRSSARHFDTLEAVELPTRFSMSGSIYRTDSDWLAAGQCQGTIREYMASGQLEYSEGWSKKRLEKLLSLWDRWHLNDLKAGTKAQTEALESFDGTDYTEHCEYLKSKELYEDRGYKYGHSWLFEPLPDDIEEQVTAILP